MHRNGGSVLNVNEVDYYAPEERNRTYHSSTTSGNSLALHFHRQRKRTTNGNDKATYVAETMGKCRRPRRQTETKDYWQRNLAASLYSSSIQTTAGYHHLTWQNLSTHDTSATDDYSTIARIEKVEQPHKLAGKVTNG